MPLHFRYDRSKILGGPSDAAVAPKQIYSHVLCTMQFEILERLGRSYSRLCCFRVVPVQPVSVAFGRRIGVECRECP